METRRKLRIVATVCVLVACWAARVTAKVIYVDGDAAGANNGSSWANAFVHLQNALAVAQSGDEIRVAQGCYRPDQGLAFMGTRGGPAITPPEAVFQLENGVAILGGFGGAKADDPNARDAERYRTILSGDPHGNDVDLWGPGNPIYESLRKDNSRHVVQSIGTDATAVLDGFVIESATDSDFFNQGASPTIVNCIFQKGSTSNSGGALRCDGGHATLTNCVFQGNCSTNSRGGAIDLQGGQLTLSNCRFLGNWAWQEGGAICSTDADLALTGCTFGKNAGSWGGAIHQTAGALTLTDCSFEGNAANEGGAVAFLVEAASLTRCVFARNWAVTKGGAVENGGGQSPTFDECTFAGNTAGEGGAIYALRIAVPTAAPGMVLTHCLFTGNRAYNAGGALYDERAGLAIRSCTFTGNWAQRAAALAWQERRSGDARYVTTLDNCIVWDGSGSIARVLRATRAATSSPEEVIVHYSDVQGGWSGEGNIDADPCFAALGRWVDTNNPEVTVTPSYSNSVWVEGDCHLKSQTGRWNPASGSWVLDGVTSPCIDAGDPKSPTGGEPEPNGGRINMGAYGGTAEASKSLSR